MNRFNDDDMEILGANDLGELAEPELLGGGLDEPLGGVPMIIDTEREEPRETEGGETRRVPRLQPVNKGGVRTNVDVTIGIDVTESMDNLIGVIKRDVVNFRELVYERLRENMERKRKDRVLNRMRLRIVAFRDFKYDWEAYLQPWHGPILCSDFFDLDDEYDRQALQEFVNKLEATGGEDVPESGLEALHYAIRSDWDFEPGIAHRHVIMLFTDAPAHPLLKLAERDEHYPTDADIPEDLAQLQNEFENDELIGKDYRRLLLFAPLDVYPWNEISFWNATTASPMIAEHGLEEIELESIISALTGSIGAAL